jgi:hypothetical protein
VMFDALEYCFQLFSDPIFEVFGYMPLLREALDLQLPLNLKLNIFTSSSLLMTFLVAGVFLTKFNKIRDVNKNFHFLEKIPNF